MKCQAYIRVTSQQEALDAAARYGEKTLFVAGATDVLVKARESEPYAQRVVVEISDARDMACVRESEYHLHIGALCTHTQLAGDPLVKSYCGMLAQACASVGSPQVRNRGTIGGNIANASPAADSLPALAAMHAMVICKGSAGERVVELSSFIQGAYRTAAAPDELITEIVIDKLPPQARQGFCKVARRNALAISRLTVAAGVEQDAQGRVVQLRLALGSVFPHPMVFDAINRVLVGEKPTRALIEQVAEQLSEQIPKIAGIRASTAYKQPVSRMMIERVLTQLMEVQ